MEKQEYKRDKVTCNKCYWEGNMTQMLMSTNPFDLAEVIIGCPKCFSINSLSTVCCIPECWEGTTHGFSVKDDYLWICSDHFKEHGKQ